MRCGIREGKTWWEDTSCRMCRREEESPEHMLNCLSFKMRVPESLKQHLEILGKRNLSDILKEAPEKKTLALWNFWEETAKEEKNK